jgi:hypothetical protein
MGIVEFQESVSVNDAGEIVTSRMLDVWTPDISVPKNGPGAYNYYIVTGEELPPTGCGNPVDCAVNLSTDVFAYWGRDPYRIDEDFPWICAQYGMPGKGEQEQRC